MSDLDFDLPSVRLVPRPEKCPECGYLLEGLPREGLCPECGFTYGDTIILYGWPGNGPPPLWRSLLSAIPIAAGAAWWISGLMLGFLESFQPIPFVFHIHVALVVACVCLAVWGCVRQTHGPPPLQVRFGPQGLGERTGIGPLKLTPWDPRIRVQTRILRNGYCRIDARFTGFVTGRVDSQVVHASVKDGRAVLHLLEHFVPQWQGQAST